MLKLAVKGEDLMTVKDNIIVKATENDEEVLALYDDTVVLILKEDGEYSE